MSTSAGEHAATIADGAMLTYQSRDGGAMEPGELVLWDAVPEPVRKKRLTTSNGIVVSIMIVLVVAGWTYHELVPTSLAAILTFGFAIAALKALNDWFGAVDTINVTSEHRVTTRRVIRTHKHATPAVTQLDLEDLLRVTVRRDRTGRANVQFNGVTSAEPGETEVTFEGVADVPALLRLTLPMPARLNRRAKFRRGRAASALPSDTLTVVNDARASVPDDVQLLDGEVVLWHGRPRTRERIDTSFIIRKGLTLVALVVPVTILLAAAGALGPRWHVWHWVPTAVSVLWLWTGVYTLTIGPIRDAGRRRRTRHYLTNVRMITHEGGPKAETRSTMLDMAGSAILEQAPDGTGTVRLSIGGAFDHIERPAEVYALVVEAIRAAGGPASNPTEPHEPQHVGGRVLDQA